MAEEEISLVERQEYESHNENQETNFGGSSDFG